MKLFYADSQPAISKIANRLFTMKCKKKLTHLLLASHFSPGYLTVTHFLQFELSSCSPFILLHFQHSFFVNSSILCGGKSISFARPINVCMLNNMLVQCYGIHMADVAIQSISFLERRATAFTKVGIERSRLHILNVQWMCYYGLNAICSFVPMSFHFKCNLPTVICSNVLHSKYFSP